MSLDVYLTVVKPTEIYWRNITHNMGKMADAAGIYEALWRPEEIGITKAEQLIVPLKKGLKKLLSNSKKFKKYNPQNGWGSYDALVEFVTDYLKACEENPDAEIRVSR